MSRMVKERRFISYIREPLTTVFPPHSYTPYSGTAADFEKALDLYRISRYSKASVDVPHNSSNDIANTLITTETDSKVKQSRQIR